MPERPIKTVLQEHTVELMALPGVVGTGLGQCQGEPCIKVFVAAKTPDLQAKIPTTLDGYQVVVEETGTFRALGS